MRRNWILYFLILGPWNVAWWQNAYLICTRPWNKNHKLLYLEKDFFFHQMHVLSIQTQNNNSF
jgi:hypothetical protein